MLLLPSLTGMDMMSGGYALRFVGFFIVIAGLVTWWLYQGRAALLERIWSGQGLLAHWTYDVATARQHAEQAYAEQRSMHRGLFLLTAAMLLVAGFFFLIVPMLRGEDLIVGGVLLYFAFIPFLGWIAWLTPRLAYRRALQAGADAYIAQDGAYVAGALHAWSQPFTRLERVHLQLKREGLMLELDIGNLTRVGWVHYQTNTLSVPVPAGQEDQAEQIVSALSARLHGG
jgi:hypothetical protein